MTDQMTQEEVLAQINGLIDYVENDSEHEPCEQPFARKARTAIVALYAREAALREALELAYYTGMLIGTDCAYALADLQDSGVYTPRCDDGKPSNANARRDYNKLIEIAPKIRQALAQGAQV